MFHAATDGGIRCVDAESGTLKWSAWTAGPILFAPTVTAGRLFLGSGDGRVYCYEAASGRLLWRFQAAPQRRYIGLFGQLADTWPVYSQMLERDGKVYAAAGYLPEDGMYVYALDARDGSVKWVNKSLGNKPDQPNAGRCPQGGMTITGGRLWVACPGFAATALNLENGELAPVPDHFARIEKPQGVMGKDLFTFQDQWVLMGGQRLLADHYERTGSTIKIGRWVRYDFLKLDDADRPQWPTVELPNTIQAPAWDAKLFVTPLEYRTRLEGWDTAKLIDTLNAKREEGSRTKFQFYRADRVPLLALDRKTTEQTPMRKWGPLDYDVNALAVAANAVVLTHRTTEKNGPEKWWISSLDRDTGKERWKMELPTEPLMDGLAISGRGDIYVMLREGGLLALH